MANLRTIRVKSVEDCTNYDVFKLIQGNRPIDPTQVKKLMKSFMKFGSCGRTIIGIETSSITGKKETYIADGQHSLTACKNLQIPFDYKVVKMVDDTRENVMKYIATLNNSAKSWGTKIYLNSFIDDITKPEYKVFATAMTESGLSITDLLYIFMGDCGNKSLQKFKDGELNFPNIDKSLELYNITKKLKSILPKKAFTRRSYYKIMYMSGNFKKMGKVIAKAEKTSIFSDDEAEFFNQLVKMYKSEFKDKIK